MMELANPLSPYRGLADFRYYSDKIFPHVNGQIEYVGEIAGKDKMPFINRAKALLFPIKWNEPFGMAVVEALACGTPVVAMNRGAMPEIITHGENGFLANNYQEFKEYMQRVGEIDPKACRASVRQKFSADRAAKGYIDRYKTVIALAQGR
jgi:glycosyltransferase involved in cell wall biosynthesis